MAADGFDLRFDTEQPEPAVGAESGPGFGAPKTVSVVGDADRELVGAGAQLKTQAAGVRMFVSVESEFTRHSEEDGDHGLGNRQRRKVAVDSNEELGFLAHAVREAFQRGKEPELQRRTAQIKRGGARGARGLCEQLAKLIHEEVTCLGQGRFPQLADLETRHGQYLADHVVQSSCNTLALTRLRDGQLEG